MQPIGRARGDASAQRWQRLISTISLF